MNKSMDLVCFGAGEKSKYVRGLIEGHTSHRVAHYVENSLFHKISTVFDGLEVISVYKLKQLYENGSLGG